jgi:hypothetical protein
MSGRICEDPPHDAWMGRKALTSCPLQRQDSPTPRANVRWGNAPTSFSDGQLRRRNGGGASADSSGASRR